MTKYKDRCPICDSDVTVDEDRDSGNGVILEREMDCSACGYLEYYGYGNYLVRIAREIFEWSYDQKRPEELVRAIARERDRYIDIGQDSMTPPFIGE